MAELQDFVGTWKYDGRYPRSSHTITWRFDGRQLHGRWVVESTAADEEGNRKSFDLPVGDPWLENGVLLFHVLNGPWPSEFRLLSGAEAIVGASEEKLPPQLRTPEHQRSIEGHRVRLTRQTPATH
jgi:hypothetical protein